jgi:hypothetical protein
LFLVATSVSHEIRPKLGEFLENTCQWSASRPDTDFVTDTLDFEFDVAAIIGKIGRDSNGLGIAVPENPSGLHFISHNVCTMDVL